MKKTNLITYTTATAMIGLFLIMLNLLVFSSLSLTIVSIFIIPLGPFLYEYEKYRRNKEVEERFPDFLRDVSQNIRTGMTVPQAIIATKENHYGALTPYVRRMVIQIDWGVSLDRILIDFARKTTKSMRRIVSSIIDTHRGGGDIAGIFESVGKSTVEINRINQERSSIIYNQMLTGYVIFFVFIGTIIMLQVYLIPSFQTFSAPEAGLSGFSELSGFYSNVFRILIIIQGFFSGLVIGKLSEGSIISGLKHSIILVIVGSVALLIFA